MIDNPEGSAASKRAEKRRRDAYLCLWVNRTARDELDDHAARRGISRSEMARTVFGYGIAYLRELDKRG